MEAAPNSWRSLGEHFVERGLISEADLERALAEQVATKRRLADILVRRGLVTGHDITNALMEQLGTHTPMQATPVATAAPAPTPLPTTVPTLAAVVEPGPELVVAATEKVDPSVSAHTLIAEADSRRRGAEAELNAAREAHAQVMCGLDQVRTELEARDLSTESLVREVEETRIRLRNREEELATDVATWAEAQREAERCGIQLAELRARFEKRINERSEAGGCAAARSDRAEEIDAEATVLAGRVHAAVHALDDLASRFPSNGADPSSRSASSTVLYFVPSADGFDLVERNGDVPSIGAAVEFDDQAFVVTKIGRSPLPFDRRDCVFLATV
jgi:hypothetical protein